MKEMEYHKLGCMPEVLDQGTYKGFKYTVINYGFPYALISVPSCHSLFGKEYDEVDIKVHGELTHSDFNEEGTEWEFGWSYTCPGDYYIGCKVVEGKKWTTEEVLADIYQAIEQVAKMN